jgi:ATP-binding cassette subfamily F protein 3
VALAMMALAEANLLVFDEPTNHLDVESIEALEESLEAYEGTVILVSHDRALLRNLVTRVWSLEGTCIEDVEGTFDDWESWRAGRAREARAAAQGRGAEPKRPRPKAPPEDDKRARQAAARTQARRREAAEARVAELDADLRALEARLADPALYQRRDGAIEATKLTAERDRVRAERDRTVAEWEALVAGE